MIELVELRKSFGSVEVLQGITAHVGRGEVVCIIGPSGSGKSTILRCINGLEDYDGGSVMVEGTGVDRGSAAIKSIRTQIAMELLSRVGLNGQAHAYPVELSGSSALLVAIARALAMQSNGIRIYEPTSA